MYSWPMLHLKTATTLLGHNVVGIDLALYFMLISERGNCRWEVNAVFNLVNYWTNGSHGEFCFKLIIDFVSLQSRRRF